MGGNILGRGLTIDNLLVTYYLRRAKVSQMDTVLQHARMFGYRQLLMPYTRVFLPDSLGARFHFIHVAEQNLRQQLNANGGLAKVTVETMSSLRATRLNVLDTGNLAAYEPGGHIYPGAPGLERKDLERSAIIEASVKRTLGGTLRESEFVPVELPDLLSLLRQLPFDEDLANMWDPPMLVRVLEPLRRQVWQSGFIFTGQCEGPSQLYRLVPFGPELREARNQPGAVLCVFRDDGRGTDHEDQRAGILVSQLGTSSDMATQYSTPHRDGELSARASLRRRSPPSAPSADDANDYRIATSVGPAFLARARSGAPTLLIPLDVAPVTVGRRGGGFSLNLHPRRFRARRPSLGAGSRDIGVHRVNLVDAFSSSWWTSPVD